MASGVLPAFEPCWAELELGFGRDGFDGVGAGDSGSTDRLNGSDGKGGSAIIGGTTRLHTRRHRGPLRVQKPLYPEGPECCHAIIVHPPGGILGGDQLTLTARLDPGSHAVLTTPGAAKWYKANPESGFAPARQSVNLHLASGARLEWWPQETIFFNGANACIEQTLELAADAAYIGCEIGCFGRTASGERFASGQVRQHNRIRRGNRWLWYEQGVLQAGSAGQHSRFGLAGHSVCATLLAVAPEGGVAWPAELIGQLRQALADLPGVAGQFGVSASKALLVVRLLCDASELARSAMLAAWALLRPHLMQRALVVPRIWQT